MKTDYKNDEARWMTFPRALKYTALAGILLGLSDIWFASNHIYLHWPGAYWFVLFATALFLFTCFLMILASQRSVAQVCTWTGMAYIALTHMFMTFRWPGGMTMGCYGVISLIAICAAIGYLRNMKEQCQWSRNAIGIWVIVIQLVFIVLLYVRMYYFNYVVDPFEPAIPYAENSVHYMQINTWLMKYIVMGNGLAMLLPSIYLYHVAHLNSK